MVGVSSVMVLAFWPSTAYCLYMPSIVGKKQGGRTYYYLVESARVDGKPRIVSQHPVRTQHKVFGDLAGVWSMLERLDVAGVIDQVVPRYANAAASVGTYIALATMNRVVAPCSKLAFEQWWATTAAPRLTKIRGTAVDHRRFWDAMDRLGQNSAANHDLVEQAGIGFVGSLPPSDHPALLALGKNRYTDVDADKYPGLTCIDTTVTALGVTRRAVLTHSPTLHAKQSRGFDQTLAKPSLSG